MKFQFIKRDGAIADIDVVHVLRDLYNQPQGVSETSNLTQLFSKENHPISCETVQRIYKEIEANQVNSGNEFQQFEDISRLVNQLEGSNWNILRHFGVTYGFRDPSTDINRSVVLVNDNIHSQISEINISGYHDRYYKFMIEARNEFAYDQIVRAMGPREFYETSFLRNSVTLATNNLSLISHLIKRLLSFDPTLNPSLEHVMSIIKNDLEKAYTEDNIPVWLRRCDIKSPLYNPESTISRKGIYHNTRPGDHIKIVEVHVYKGTRFLRMGITARNEEGLMKLIEKFGPHEFYEVSRFSDEIYVSGNSAPKFASFFSKLLEIQPDFRPCFNELQTIIHLDLSKELSQHELERFPPSRMSPDYNETVADLTQLQIDRLRRASEGSAQRAPTLSFSARRAKQYSHRLAPPNVDQELGGRIPRRK
jgi:hypothetical protein